MRNMKPLVLLLALCAASCQTTTSYPVRWAIIDADQVTQEAKVYYGAKIRVAPEFDPSTNAVLKANLDQIASLETEKSQILRKYARHYMPVAMSSYEKPPERTPEDNKQIAVIDEKLAMVKPSIGGYTCEEARRSQVASKVASVAIKIFCDDKYDTVFSTRSQVFLNSWIVHSRQMVLPPNITDQVIADMKKNWDKYEKLP